MLHKLSVYSVKTVLHHLKSKTVKFIEIEDLVQPIPDSIEEQESILQVIIS